MATLSFSIAASAFDTSLLPAAARQAGTPAFREAINGFLAGEFKGFGGHATIRVDDQTISVAWDPDSQRPNPMAAIVQKLQQGKQAEGIQLLELFLSNHPDDPVVLYNLGLALSDAGRLERAEHCLRQAAELNPNDTNIPVALGMALGRMGRCDEAVAVLRAAVRQEPKNPWAHRNLGAMLVQTEQSDEAVAHYQTATQLLPDDQIAWLGLADACRLAGRTKEAQDAYGAAIKLNPHGELADKARTGSNLLAQSGFDRIRKVVPRQDAVHYCLDALQRVAKLSPDELKKLCLELALAGRDGFAVHDPDRRYRLKGLEGDFSGLAMVCFLHVAMQRLAPGTDIGFDVATEYEQAKEMFDASC
ncbi:MAG: tetratricopeptide repeat protein [Limisphaerales bacterium]